MSTILEAAQTIRAEEAAAIAKGMYPSGRGRAFAQRVDLSDEYQIRNLCRLYGVTPNDIVRAVEQVGNELPVVQHLLLMQ